MRSGTRRGLSALDCAILCCALLACGRAGFDTRDAGRELRDVVDAGAATVDTAPVDTGTDLRSMDVTDDRVDSSFEDAMEAMVDVDDATADVNDANTSDGGNNDASAEVSIADVPDSSCRVLPPCVATGTESCDGLDNDCNGLIDDGSVCGLRRCDPLVVNGHTFLACAGVYTWHAAEEACRLAGGALAELRSVDERFAVAAALAGSGAVIPIATQELWVGATDEACEGMWRHVSDGAFVPATTFAPGEPNGGAAENCALFLYPHSYRDVPCSLGRGFLCEMPGPELYPPWTVAGACTPPLTPLCTAGDSEICNGRDDDCVAGNEAPVCPTPTCMDLPVAALGGRVYRFCSDLRTRDAARASCAAGGMQLVVINDATEGVEVAAAFDAALGVARSQHWIEGSDEACEGMWVDTDGAPMFANWRSGEPNNGGPHADGEHCAGIDTAFSTRGRMFDMWCPDGLLSYVCEPTS